MRTIGKIRPRGCAIRMGRGLVAMALCAGLTIPLGAAVIDDFGDGVKSGGGGGDMD